MKLSLHFAFLAALCMRSTCGLAMRTIHSLLNELCLAVHQLNYCSIHRATP